MTTKDILSVSLYETRRRLQTLTSLTLGENIAYPSQKRTQKLASDILLIDLCHCRNAPEKSPLLPLTKVNYKVFHNRNNLVAYDTIVAS